jgi:hypothetical protein
MQGGGTFVNLKRLTDGRVMCCLCFGYFPKEELEPTGEDDGSVFDMCRVCAEEERMAMESRSSS